MFFQGPQTGGHAPGAPLEQRRRLLESLTEQHRSLVSKTYALIPAAGAGARMGAAAPKQYLEIGGRPLLHYALRAIAAHPRVETIFVVLAQDDTQFARYDRRELGTKLEPLYCGGETRAASVLNGLLAARHVMAPSDWVLVHDAARPCLGRGELDRL